MRLLLTFTIAVSLIVHAFLGCCAHHAHAAPSEPTTHECAQHGDHNHDGQHDQPCEEGECVFASGAARVIIDSPFGPAYSAAHALLPVGMVDGVRLASVDVGALPGGPELCILHQRLVI
jgi:hypothetical protein